MKFETVLQNEATVVIASPSKFEAMMVAKGRLGEAGPVVVRDLIALHAVEVRDWTDALAEIAIDAFIKFGKGQHKAKLNFGDCMAYALAKSLNAPLLYKGDDFAQTDIRSAL